MNQVAAGAKKMALAECIIFIGLICPIITKSQSIVFENGSELTSTPNISRHEIENELAKYPKGIIEENLKNVVVVSSDKYCGLSLAFAKKIELSGDCQNCNIRSTIHHELSSLFLIQNPGPDDAYYKKLWKEFNALNDSYSYTGNLQNQPIENGSDIANHFYKRTYAMHSFENDFNVIAESLFVNGHETLQFANEHPNLPVSKKIQLVIEFYQKVSSDFTTAYFEKQKI